MVYSKVLFQDSKTNFMEKKTTLKSW